jgi:hypothetical protein
VEKKLPNVTIDDKARITNTLFAVLGETECGMRVPLRRVIRTAERHKRVAGARIADMDILSA